MNANRNANGRMGARNSERRAGAAILAVVVGLGLSASAAFGQYYTDPNYPGWIYDPYYGWIYIGEGETGTPTDDTTIIDTTSTTQVSGGGAYQMVAVGINEYLNSTPLSACVNDVLGLTAALKADGSRWNDQNITTHTDTWATKQSVRSSLYNMGLGARAGDVCVYFQSSHGAQHEGTSMSLVMHDELYSDQELGQDLANFFGDGVNVVVIVDACFSGGLFKDASSRQSAARAFSGFSQNVMNSFNATKAAAKDSSALARGGANIAFMTASDFDQVSLEIGENGLFAGNIIKAFSAPESDANADGNLSFLELFNWARPQALEHQNPQVLNEALLSQTIAVQRSAGGVLNSSSNAAPAGLCGVMGAMPMMACVAAVGAMGMGSRRRARRGR